MVTSFLVAAVIAGTPLLLAILGEIITEKAGILNLGVEGMMLIGAIAGFATAFYTNNPLFSLVGAALAGGFGALIFAFLTISFRANQIVTGLALTIFGTGISSFLGTNFVGQKLPETVIDFFQPFKIPLLGDIPYIGEIFFNQDFFIYISYVIAIVLGVYLYRTRKGLNLRAIGESTSTADAAGINVTLYKYVHVVLGGALCGLGGAYLSVVDVPQWQENITSGRGWIAIALVIFCAWNPYKALFGAYLFGGLSIIGFRIQAIDISQNLINMLPYIVTILVLVLSSYRKSKDNGAPKGLGEPYFREER